MFSQDKEPFNFIKCSGIQKLAYKVKYIDQIYGSLIMFFGNLKVRFFKKISLLNCE